MGLFNKLFGNNKKVPSQPAPTLQPQTPPRPETLSVTSEKGLVLAPVTGSLVANEDIPDALFAQEILGRTVAVKPEDDIVYAPVAGTVVTVMPHAVGIKNDDDVEVLVHIGVDTVSLDGRGFTTWAKQGDRISAGEALASFNSEAIVQAGFSDLVMTIVTSPSDLAATEVVARDAVLAGAPIARVV